jgi:DHA2 family multidrug resistance protein-like MFS transporter
MAADLPAGVPAAEATLARDTLGGAVEATGQLPADVGTALLGTAREAFTQGIHVVAVISAVLVVGAVVLVLTRLPRTPAAGDASSVSEAENPKPPDRVARAA